MKIDKIKFIALSNLIFAFVFVFFVMTSYAKNDTKLIDEANLLSKTERIDLQTKLYKLSEENKVDILVITKESLGTSSIEEFADDYFDYNDYGYGEDRDGIILVLAMREREYHFSTSGYGIEAFTDSGLAYLWEQMKTDISKGDYYKAFDIYADKSAEFIKSAKKGKIITGKEADKIKALFDRLGLSALSGLGVSLYMTLTSLMGLKARGNSAFVNNYIVKDSLNISDRTDRFLYRNISKIPLSQVNKASSSAKSLTHTSSSGRVHGGHGGKF